jgi:hypothetical protein
LKTIALVCLLASFACAQVPSSFRGSPVFAIALPEGAGIGWNFSLGTDDETGHNQFSWDETTFNMSAEVPIGVPYQLVTLTGVPSKIEADKANDLGCFYVKFRVEAPVLTVSELDGSSPKQSTPKMVNYFQEFCSLGGGADDFWAAGGLTIIQ